MHRETLSSVFIGSDSLLLECAEIWRADGHQIAAVVTSAPRIAAFARTKGIALIDAGSDYGAALEQHHFDHLFAITHLSMIPERVIAQAKRSAINFHDGPLPSYAGLNAPAWALIKREREYGITWHVMTAAVDGGDVLKQVRFEIGPDETSLSLNTRCFAQAIESFGQLVKELATGSCVRAPQAQHGRSYFGRHARPDGACVIDWQAGAADIAALVRALDFGPRYPNTLGAATLLAGDRALVVAAAEARPSSGAAAPGTILALDDSGLAVATGEDTLVVTAFRELDGTQLPLGSALAHLGLQVGGVLPQLDAGARAELGRLDAELAKAEAGWVRKLTALDPPELPYARPAAPGESAALDQRRELHLPQAFSAAFPGEVALAAAFGLYVGRLGGVDRIALAFADRGLAERAGAFGALIATSVPLLLDVSDSERFADVIARCEAELAKIQKRGAYLRNLGARYPELSGSALARDLAGLSAGVALGVTAAAGSVLQLHVEAGQASLRYASARIDEAGAERVAGELVAFLENLARDPQHAVSEVELLSAAAKQQLDAWNETAVELPADACVHTLIEAQVDRTPDAIAVACEDAALSYRELDEAANRLAARLRALGVGAQQTVGIHLERSVELVVAALAVLKAGAAYVPLDPAYPEERIALMIEDARLKVVITQQALAAGLQRHGVIALALDAEREQLAQLPAERPASAVRPDQLAYLIYTSGSTGKPKGVMIEHRQVVNFFAGMDARVPHEPPGAWLAVTSLSFDIAVLELLWTLTRGFKVVVHADRARAAATASPRAARKGGTAKRVQFSLFYFSADAQAEGSERYRLLLDGARFADAHGFSAVWTPERHFHAFGGLYPNPAVTGAAVAAITKHVGVRAGSVVLPLHHPVRVVEAWSIVDNISNGRVGVSMASGWQPNDFVLMPENYKDAKGVMLRNLEVVRKLWRGESVAFPGPSGDMVSVQTQPRPVQKELPIWLTTAGNIETFEAAGRAGANVLTHLLGQTIDKLAPKLAAYRAARAAAGFDPTTGIVSLMLHTFVGEDRARVRELVRAPLKAYLATSMDLIKDKAWLFPAFSRPKGADAAGGGNELAELSPEDRDALLDAAFERYFETSGLFGTVEDALATVQKLKAIGVDDVACLIDFGVPTQTVLDHLPFLNRVREAEQSAEPVAAGDGVHPFLRDVLEHGVTHLQCTPSMARMLLAHEESRAALGRIAHLFVGGEALPADLLRELRAATRATITNMYGPTETTVWSTTHALAADETTVPIGKPIANTSIYVTDAKRRRLPAGVIGELWIGGLGVARGYFERDDLTRERFVQDPFAAAPGVRMYRTGDRARLRSDGVIEFFGRADFQVKVRGYRIEPGEIEACVRKQPGVAECVVIQREDRPGDPRLVAYVVPAPAIALDPNGLRDALRAELPEHMVPAHFVALAELPLTPNRKLDRKALPAPEQAQAVAAPTSGPKPENEIERTIAAVWEAILGREGVGLDDNFFDLGGHSLLVVRMHRRLQEVLERSLALTDLYRFPTIRAFTGFLNARGSGDSRKGAERGARRRELLQRRGR